MAENETGFSPEMPDEDVEQSPGLLSIEDAQLTRELRAHYSLTRARSTRVLEHAWQRIQQSQRLAAPEVHSVQIPEPYEIKRKLHMKEIPSDLKKPGLLRRLLNILAAAVLLVVIVGSLMLVYGHLHEPATTAVGSQANLAMAAAATPSPTTGQTGSGNNGVSPNYPVGQSTYWANLRYYQLTGHWVAWEADADQWVSSARAAGWHVSSSPHVPSILVLKPHVQGTGNDWHVAVVESIVNSTTVHTSNMEPHYLGSAWTVVYDANFKTGSGVYFIWT